MGRGGGVSRFKEAAIEGKGERGQLMLCSRGTNGPHTHAAYAALTRALTWSTQRPSHPRGICGSHAHAASAALTRTRHKRLSHARAHLIDPAAAAGQVRLQPVGGHAENLRTQEYIYKDWVYFFSRWRRNEVFLWEKTQSPPQKKKYFNIRD